MKVWVVFQGTNPHILELENLFVFSTRENAAAFCEGRDGIFDTWEVEVDSGRGVRERFDAPDDD